MAVVMSWLHIISATVEDRVIINYFVLKIFRVSAFIRR